MMISIIIKVNEVRGPHFEGLGRRPMKITREQAEQNRERILAAAVELFKAKGFDGVSVAEVMARAGFTHGGFYGHFESKEDLIAAVCEQDFSEKLAMWVRDLTDQDTRDLEQLTSRYLAARHRDDLPFSCPLPCWAVDVARQPPSIRRRFTQGFAALVEFLATKIPGRSKLRRRRQAIARWSSLVGAIVLARAVDDEDLSDEILKAVSDEYHPPQSK